MALATRLLDDRVMTLFSKDLAVDFPTYFDVKILNPVKAFLFAIYKTTSIGIPSLSFIQNRTKVRYHGR